MKYGIYLYKWALLSLTCSIWLLMSRDMPKFEPMQWFTLIFLTSLSLFIFYGLHWGFAKNRVKVWNTHYIVFNAHFQKKRYWFSGGFFWSIILFLNNPFADMPYKWTISRYNNYEWINSHAGFFQFIWRLYYKKQGFTGENIKIEPYKNATVHHYSPYSN